MGRTICRATREFWNFGNEGVVLLTPLDHDLVLGVIIHPSLLPVDIEG